MMASLKKLASILKSDEGMVSVEYGLILSGVVVVATALTAGFATLSSTLETLMNSINTTVSGNVTELTGT